MSKFNKKDKEVKEVIEYPIYTARDFFIIKEELEKYAIDKEFTERDGSKKIYHFVPVEGLEKWYIEKGALSSLGGWTIKDIPLFKELQNKIEQYDKWSRRREYAQKNSLDYKDIVDSMAVDK